MNIRFIMTLLLSSMLELTLAAYLKIHSPLIWIHLAFWTLVLTIIFGIANKGFKQKRTREEIKRRWKLVVKSYRITYMLMLALNLLLLLPMPTARGIFGQATVIIIWHATIYLFIISQCRLKGETEIE